MAETRAGGGRLSSTLCRRTLWLVLLLPPLIVACGGDSTEGAYREYYERLQRTLDLGRAPSPQPPPPVPPRSGALQLTLESGDINALDFLALHGCALQINIGRRNSSLGRLAKASQTLLLDLEFMRLAPECIEELEREGRNALVQQLKKALALKRTQLPARVFNATLGSDEYRAFWRAKRPPGEFPAVPDAFTLQALYAINAAVQRWLTGDYSVEDFEFELLLSEVAGGSGGSLLRGFARQAHWLAEADALLQARHNRGPLCASNLRHSAADILPNVVAKYFVARIQPGAVALNSAYQALVPPVRELESLLRGALPSAYQGWHADRDALLERGARAPRLHVESIQGMLEDCGATAGLGSVVTAQLPLVFRQRIA